MNTWSTFRDWHRDPAFWRDLYARTVSGLAVAGVLVGVAGITGLISRGPALLAAAIAVFGWPLVRIIVASARVASAQIGRRPHLLIATVAGAAFVVSLVFAVYASWRGSGPTATLVILVGGPFVATAVTLVGVGRRRREAA